MEIDFGKPYYFTHDEIYMRSIILEQAPNFINDKIYLSNLLKGEYKGYAIMTEPIDELYDDNPILKAVIIYDENYDYLGYTIKIFVGKTKYKNLILEKLLPQICFDLFAFISTDETVKNYYLDNKFEIITDVFREGKIKGYLVMYKSREFEEF